MASRRGRRSGSRQPIRRAGHRLSAELERPSQTRRANAAVHYRLRDEPWRIEGVANVGQHVSADTVRELCVAVDKCDDPLRVGTCMLAQGPPDGLAQEEGSVARARFDGRRQQSSVGALLGAELADDRRSAQPPIRMLRPVAYQWNHRFGLGPQDRPDEVLSDLVDVVPPRSAHDPVSMHGEPRDVWRQPAGQGRCDIALLTVCRLIPELGSGSGELNVVAALHRQLPQERHSSGLRHAPETASTTSCTPAWREPRVWHATPSPARTPLARSLTDTDVRSIGQRSSPHRRPRVGVRSGLLHITERYAHVEGRGDQRAAQAPGEVLERHPVWSGASPPPDPASP